MSLLVPHFFFLVGIVKVLSGMRNDLDVAGYQFETFLLVPFALVDYFPLERPILFEESMVVWYLQGSWLHLSEGVSLKEQVVALDG